MGARGPAPKDPATRQRRNRSPGANTIEDHDPLPRDKIPPLKKRLGADGKPIEWSKLARAYWRELWKSPVAKLWTRSDVWRVWLYLDLFDQWVTTRELDVLKELRLQSPALGIAPMDRRRMDWSVVPHEPDGDDKKTATPPQRSERPADPRAALRAVT